MSNIPKMTADTVFLIGNGILRVPSVLAAESDGDMINIKSPSWLQYMEQLWSLVFTQKSTKDLLSLSAFLNLSAPRQAEWFDNNYETIKERVTSEFLAMIRLHLLGHSLYPSYGVLTNPLLQTVSQIILNQIVQKQRSKIICDIITTNLDCSIEQNLALAVEDLSIDIISETNFEIKTIIDFRHAATWKHSSLRKEKIVIFRLWKIHGCLHDIKQNTKKDDQKWVTRSTNAKLDMFCGALPKKYLLENRHNKSWRYYPCAETASQRTFSIFSQSEYFKNIEEIVMLSNNKEQDGENIARSRYFGSFKSILKNRQLLMVGYGLLDEDIDVLYALQTYKPRAKNVKRYILAEIRNQDPAKEERLRQIGINYWPFKVSPLGFCREPNKMQYGFRHEWRIFENEEMKLPPAHSWKAAIQSVVAQAWLEPQHKALVDLFLQSGGTAAQAPSPPYSRGVRRHGLLS